MHYNKIKHIVFTVDLKNLQFIKEAAKRGVNCIPIIDARSAVYTATGICAQNQEIVAVCLGPGNTSRSSYSGMTEAYYRNLPVVLITFGIELDYSEEPADVVHGHYVVSSESEIDHLLEKQLPIHIEVDTLVGSLRKYRCEKTQEILKQILDEKEYLYIGQGIQRKENFFKCKLVEGGMPNCYEGAMANILGASLAKKHKKYIGLIVEEEFVHDMNTLGNINVNDSLLFIVVSKKHNMILENYAKSLAFEVHADREKNMTIQVMEKLINNMKKIVLFIYQEG